MRNEIKRNRKKKKEIQRKLKEGKKGCRAVQS